jgi:STE24 endopeptidase
MMLAIVPALAWAQAVPDAVAVPEPTAQALAYYDRRILLWLLGLALGVAVPALVLFSGAGARIAALAQRIGRRWVLALWVFLALYGVLTWLVELPLAYFGEFFTEHEFGLSNQGLGKWLQDSVVGLAVGIVVSCLVLALLYLAIRKSPRRWWLWAGFGTLPVIVLLILVTPIWVEPLFNRFGPMQDKVLEARILALADRAGIEGARIFEVAKSEDTKKLNAYVTGFAGTKRIVLWDTLIKALDADQTAFVMGHEMGHYVLGHIWRTLLALTAASFFLFWATDRIARWALARWSGRFGFNELSSPASWPLLLLIFSVLIFALTPALNLLSRYHERQADIFGLEITQNNRAAATGFVRLQQENLGVPRPNPIVYLWWGSHPSLADRIEFANSYRPWAEGKPLQFGDEFK